MPNASVNTLTIRTDNDTVRHIVEDLRGEDSVLDFTNILPPRDGGWDRMFDVYDATAEISPNGQVVYSFVNDYVAPIPAIALLAKKYPQARITIHGVTPEDGGSTVTSVFEGGRQVSFEQADPC